MTDPRLPVSEEEVRRVAEAIGWLLPNRERDWSRVAYRALETIRRYDVPRIERALEEALVAAIREILRNPGDPRPKLKVKSYAAFWRAMEEK